MITRDDLQAAIAECQGKRNPDATTCIKLAAFYTIQREMFGEQPEQEPQYSFSAAPEQTTDTISFNGKSEFAQAINGRKQAEIWPVLDELMATVQVIEPRLYAAVMDKLT